MPIELKKTTEAGGSMNDHIEMVQTAWRQSRDGEPGPYTYVMDVFPDAAIVCWGGYDTPKRRYYRVPYTVTDDGVAFANENNWQEVTLSYVPANASDSEAETEVATESSLLESGRVVIEATSKGPEAVIVVEGESFNRNVYSEAALQSGVGVFTGKPVYADHPTRSEEKERPERSVRDLVGRLGEAYIGKDKNGRKALRAPLTMSESANWLKTLINEGIAGDMSLRASAKGKRDGEGRFTVESFVDHPHTSVDIVTSASAGGYAALTEAVRESSGFWSAVDEDALRQHRPDLVEKIEEGAGDSTVQWVKESRMTPEEIQKIQETNQVLLEENATLFRRVREDEAQRLIETLPALKGMPGVIVTRVLGLLKPVMETYASHGSTTTPEQFKAEATAIVQAEKAYLAKVAPHGVVRGISESVDESDQAEKQLEEALSGILGGDPNQVKVALRGR